MTEPITLRPEHEGKFEIFSTKFGKRYARYSDNAGHTWYAYDFFTESYQSLSNETVAGAEDLIRTLEQAYRVAPILPLTPQ